MLKSLQHLLHYSLLFIKILLLKMWNLVNSTGEFSLFYKLSARIFMFLY